MADINIGKAPPNSAVLPFYATAAIAFLILTILMLISTNSFAGHYFNPHLLSIVHTAALGWGTMIIYGASYQLLPVICEKDLFSNSLASSSWFVLTIGVVLLVTAFWNLSNSILLITGGSLIVLSAILFAVNVWLTAGSCSKYTIQKRYISTAAFWLLFTTIVGLLLAINLYHPFFTKNHLNILKLHAHAGLAGWFLQLITGVSTKLVPMFLLGKSSKDKLLKLSYIFQNTGLILFLLDGYFLGSSHRFILYALLVLIGVICWLAYLYDTFKNRVRKKIEWLMKSTFASFLCLLAAFATLPVVVLAKGTQWAMLYGTLLFLGWITGIILGKTFKTLPFIVWNGHYKNLSGKVKVPLPKHLYNEQIIPFQFWLYIVALVLLSIGIICGNLIVVKVSLFLWLILAILYNYNVFKVLFHKTKILH
ncbi:MAG: hypothetical protein ACK5NK_01470 [Niabella sp.]